MTEREKFEAWCAKRYKNCAYLHTSSTCGDWDAWQAAIASREPMTEKQMKQVISETSAIALFKHQDFVRAIERHHGIGKAT